ncbi:MAG: insulinase family protein [Candidatus Nealsonbacteria bacterium]|nr:insulinase family protein [Candidatus Nealsonbacteria bacterium]
MYKKNVLKNGLRIVTFPMENTRALTLLVLVGAGSRYEKKELSGISHVLEHMAFRGTKKRPKSLDISRELDKIGGVYNAFTGKEIMGFWVKVDSKHLDLSCDIISDMIFHSLFKEKELEKEKKTILEEFNMYLDTPQAYILDLWEKVLYGDQPMGWLTIGEKEVIKKINHKDIINYFRSQFRAKNSVVVLAGDFQEKETIKKLTKYFGKFPNSKTPAKRLTIEKQKSPQVLLQQKETDQAHLAFGVRAFNIFSAKRHTLAVLANILGGNMSSRLFTEVREKRGMAYYVRTMAEGYTDVGYLATHAGIDNKRVEEALKIILKEYKKLTEKKVPQDELKKAKENLKGHLFLGLETSDAWAVYYGGQEILKSAIDTPEKECQMIDKVTQNDILKVAREIFRSDKLNLALIGPFKDKDKFQKLLKL